MPLHIHDVHGAERGPRGLGIMAVREEGGLEICLLYTSDAADE